MGLIILSLQDEPDGTVSLGVTTEPFLAEDDEITDAHVLGMIAIHAVMEAMKAPENNQDSQEESQTA